MAYEKNKQTPSRTLRYYHVQDYLLRPSCLHTKARTSSSFSLNITTRCFFEHLGLFSGISSSSRAYRV
jgi:hypothetical protein